MSLILNKKATLYTYLGEVNREAAYSVTALENVYYQEKSGVSAGASAPADTLTVYVFDRRSKVGGTVGGSLALHDDGTDIIVPGTYGAVSKPITLPGARKIMSISRYKAGTPRMWHWKVVAK